jgi:hypothetical protein
VLNQSLHRSSGISFQRRAPLFEHMPPYGPLTRYASQPTVSHFVRCYLRLLPIVIAAERLTTTYSAE